MATLKRQRGAIWHLIAQGDDERCEAATVTINTASTVISSQRCAYRSGHPGPHYSQGEIWGNKNGGR